VLFLEELEDLLLEVPLSLLGIAVHRLECVDDLLNQVHGLRRRLLELAEAIDELRPHEEIAALFGQEYF